MVGEVPFELLSVPLTITFDFFFALLSLFSSCLIFLADFFFLRATLRVRGAGIHHAER